MPSNTDVIRILKIASGTATEFGNVGNASFLIDQPAGGSLHIMAATTALKGIINIGSDAISDHIKSGDTLTVRVFAFGGWDGTWTLYPYINFDTPTATGSIQITGQGSGDSVFTITQAFIDELLSFLDAGETSIGMRLHPDNLVSGQALFINGWADTFSGAGGVTKQGAANVTALCTAGAQGGAIFAAEAAITAKALITTADGGAQRPANAAVTALVTVEADGSPVLRGGVAAATALATVTAAGGAIRPGEAAVTAKVLVTADGSPVLRGGVASVTVLATSVAAGGAQRPGNAAVTVKALITGADGSPVLRGGVASVIALVTTVAVGSKVGVTDPGFASVTALVTATAAGGAQRPGSASVTAKALITTSAAGAQRPGSAAVTAKVLITADGSPVLRGGTANATAKVLATASGGAQRPASAAPTVRVLVTADGSPVLRGGVAAATARVLTTGTVAGAKRLAIAAATALVTATATGVRLGDVLIDNENDKVLDVSMESISVISDGANWWIV